METAVVFIIFNRPDQTRTVFDEIRKAQPSQLFVVADGPRPDVPDDKTKCQRARSIVEEVDWECQVLKDFSDHNLGCKRRVSSGLNWVFENTERAIILEDDCVPGSSFFTYCEELLNRYQDDSRIFTISGDNFQQNNQVSDYSYYFSIYNHCWGWATWSRAWRHFDYEMSLWPEVQRGNLLSPYFSRKAVLKYWNRVFQSTYDNENSSWAYRWTFACWLQNGLTILPNFNLVSNIGFGFDSTHTKVMDNSLANLPKYDIEFPLRHPPYVLRNTKADNFTESQYFDASFLTRLNRKLPRFFS